MNPTESAELRAAYVSGSQAASMPVREEWIDCLRGLTMLLVVMAHFEVECGRWMAFSKWMSMIRMPMFVFISGYFAYSARIVPDVRQLVKSQWLHRLKLIIWPSALMFLLYAPCFMHVYSYTPKDVLLTGSMLGYWYTFGIFEMFVLCTPLVCLVNSGRRGRVTGTVILLLLSVVAVYVHRLMENPEVLLNKYTLLLLLNSVSGYLPFFIAGMLVHAYRERVWRLFPRLWVPAAVALTLFVLLNLHYPESFVFISDFTWTMPLFVVMTVCVFVALSGCKGVLNGGNRAGRVLSIIGRNTLPIYLFHFFFNLWIGRVVILNYLPELPQNDILWIPFVLVMTCVITAGSLGLYQLLECAGMRKYVFPGHAAGLRGYKMQEKVEKIMQP
ncbi:MAG: acyltransferase [Candidatus Amulumruptor caecigallinarius]|nr:acyltransferase [Candidatus Amulumruptor caecigallinarius]MCM1396899.1 acyltransferase [Candidatus Amulumruptor caecigallinarius]MCM1454157.1 acyltransferase [bacterium]